MGYRIISWIAVVSLFLAFLAHTIFAVGTDANRYLRLYEAHGVYEQAGVSAEDLELLTMEITLYLRGLWSSLDQEVTVDGVLRPAFGERELTHMEDVRGLFQLLERLKVIPILLLCLSLIYLRKSKKIGYMPRAALQFSLGILGLLALLATWAAVDFDSLFILFHRLSFRNDLWLLDPKTDLLIRMMPTGFFIDMAKAIGLRVAGLLILLIGGGVYRLWKDKRHPA